MKFGTRPVRSIVSDPNQRHVFIVDQTMLPFALEMRTLTVWQDAAEAIRAMRVRGAPLIGVTAAYGMAMAMAHDATDNALKVAHEGLLTTRPTAVNLAWALNRMVNFLTAIDPPERADSAWAEATRIEQEDVLTNKLIGKHGLTLLETLHRKHQRPINILTHCNAGRMACVEWGTATSLIYQAHQAGIPVHVWVDETRPRNQGLITQWEFEDAGVPHTYITDNAGGHLMQHRNIDLVIVGADRITAAGDVANKIGTYLKALAAHDNRIPFYVAAPVSTIDFSIQDGLADIEIEQRDAAEVRVIRGLDRKRMICDLVLLDDDVVVNNPGFDITPARLITGILTQHGLFKPNSLNKIPR